MNSKSNRKAAIAAYKERKHAMGVFAIRCAASGEVWVGAAPDLRTIQNRFWFTLRTKSCLNHALQQAWSLHGESSFSLEILEQLPEDEKPLFRDDVLKERAAHWRAQLNAPAV